MRRAPIILLLLALVGIASCGRNLLGDPIYYEQDMLTPNAGRDLSGTDVLSFENDLGVSDLADTDADTDAGDDLAPTVPIH